MAESLFLRSKSMPTVKVHPLVLFAILDHQTRRNAGEQRVIGTLMGRVVEGVVEITDCYPVLSEMNAAGQVAIGKEFNRRMFELHRQVTTKDTVVGWYSTTMDGVAIVQSSCLVHNYFAELCKRPVHLVVDASLRGPELSVKAFISTPLSFVERSLEAQFQQVPVEMQVTEAEQISLDAMARDTQLTAEWGGAADVTSELDNLQRSLQSLSDMLGSVASYVDDVVTGKRPADHETGRQIADALAAVPRISPAAFEKMLSGSVNDLLAVAYLANLTRTQVAIAEKLHAT